VRTYFVMGDSLATVFVSIVAGDVTLAGYISAQLAAGGLGQLTVPVAVVPPPAGAGPPWSAQLNERLGDEIMDD
jgi:hypothetical protein